MPSAFFRAGAAVAMCMAAGAAAGAPRAALVLQPASPTRLSAQQLALVCQSLPTPCSPGDTVPHVIRGHGDGPVWLIDASRPMLVALDPAEPLRSERAQVWDFSDHPHTTPPAADGRDAEPLQIHPALYPLGESDHAIALVSSVREMYSGGGASFRTADFIGLDAARTVAYGAVPFSCSRMIRACFNERDYARGHCHDESVGSLTIRHPDAGGRWSFTWRETDWPPFRPRSRATTTRTAFEIPQGNAVRPASVGFCGGPFE